MSAAKPMAMHERCHNYWLQSGSYLTPRQQRRVWHKFSRATGMPRDGRAGKSQPTPRQRKRRAAT